MAETPNLQSVTARERLPARRKPYYERIEPELFLGFRRGQDGGSWVLRYLSAKRTYKVERIATAERQRGTADGETVLDYKQALRRARELGRQRQAEAEGRQATSDWTVRDAIERYLEYLESARGRSADTRARAERDILPELGNVKLADLTTDQIESWLHRLAARPPKTRAGTPRHDLSTDEAKRQRKSTANRSLTILKAALNRAFKKHKAAPTDQPWRTAEPFKQADAGRKEYLTAVEAQRLVNACEPDFRQLVQAALLTGARYGELTAMDAGDFDPDAKAVYVRTSKSGKPRHVFLTQEGLDFFERQTAGKRSDEAMFLREDGFRWGKSHAQRPLERACKAAKIKSISFHILRHTYASHCVMGGAPLIVVAQNLGHQDTRMVEHHYSHLAQDYVRDTIQASAMRLDIQESDNVESFRPAGTNG